MSEHPDMPAAADGRCGDAAIYLLGLLDDQQTGAFLEHARGCVVCRDEVGALQPAVDILPASVLQLSAPGHVKQSVMAAVRGEAGDETRSLQSPGWRRLRLPRRAAPRRSALAFAAVMVLAVGVAIGALSAASGGGTTRVVSADVMLKGAAAMLHQGNGHAWLTVRGMPQPGAGRVYEVWVKRPGGSAQATTSLFAPTASGMATAVVPGDLAGASEVMVTQEPAGGSRLPTTPPVIVAHLT